MNYCQVPAQCRQGDRLMFTVRTNEDGIQITSLVASFNFPKLIMHHVNDLNQRMEIRELCMMKYIINFKPGLPATESKCCLFAESTQPKQRVQLIVSYQKRNM